MAFQPSGAPSGKHHEGIADPRCVWSQTPSGQRQMRMSGGLRTCHDGRHGPGEC